MILPLISTGLKIFKATRGKASSGSEMASNIVGKKTTVTGKGVGRPKSGAIVKASSNKISGANFLQSTTDPSKDKIKAKDGILEGFASIINVINKFLSSILTTLIADNKLTQKQSENERRAGELALKRQRESNLEDDGGGTSSTTTKSKSKSKGSFFDRIIKFVTSVAIGSLVLAVYKRFTDVIKFFKDTYETIKGFFEKLDEYVSPLWNIFKWITSSFSSIFKDVKSNDDEEYSKKIPKELDILEKEGDSLEKEGDSLEKESKELGGEDVDKDTSKDSIDPEVEKSRKESDDDKDAVDKFKNFVSFMGNMVLPGSPAVAGTLDGQPMREDRTFAKEMIKEHEGLKLKVYLDSEGYPTVGHGHKIDADSPEDIRNLEVGDSITNERADQLFEQDFSEHLFAAQQLPGFFDGSKRQQAALIDLTFNMGPNFLDNFPMMSGALEEGDFDEAARQLEFADPDNRPGVKSDYVNMTGRRSAPILDLLRDEGVGEHNHLKNIENILDKQSSINSKLSENIALIYQDEEEFDDSPIIVPIPKSKTKVVGGSGGNQMIVVGGEDVNSTMDKIYLAKQARVG